MEEVHLAKQRQLGKMLYIYVSAESGYKFNYYVI